MKICPNCSTQSNDDASFCQVCGFQFTKNDAQPTQNVSTPFAKLHSSLISKHRADLSSLLLPLHPRKQQASPVLNQKQKAKSLSSLA